MKSTRTIALGTLALAFSLVVGSASAATTAPAPTEAHTKCEHQAKDKHLSGAAATSFMKKCEADAAKKK